MVRHSDGYGGCSGGQQAGHSGRFGQHQGQRARPETLRQDRRLFRYAVRYHFQLPPVIDQDRQGQPGGAFLDGEQALYGRGVEDVGAKPVQGVGRKRHDAAGTQDPYGLLHLTGQGH